MKKYAAILFGALAVMCIAPGCSKKSTPVKSSAAYSNFEPTCMGVELDGSQTIRAWGKGNSKADAIEQAKKNAVNAVLFKGLSGECNMTPLVPEVNARERYSAYFNPFFKDGGEYKKYVKVENTGAATRLEAKGTASNNYGVIVVVDREKLRRQLEKDGVLTPGTTH